MWVVRRYRGEPRGLDGQALRWCTARRVGGRRNCCRRIVPIVAALRLPERLRRISTRWYTTQSYEAFCGQSRGRAGDAGRLAGVLCDGARDAETAAAAGADFLVLRERASAGRARRSLRARPGTGVRARPHPRAGMGAGRDRDQRAAVIGMGSAIPPLEPLPSLDALDRLALGYLVVPLVIFLAGWLEIWAAFPLLLCLGYSLKVLIDPARSIQSGGSAVWRPTRMQLAAAVIGGLRVDCMRRHRAPGFRERRLARARRGAARSGRPGRGRWAMGRSTAPRGCCARPSLTICRRRSSANGRG